MASNYDLTARNIRKNIIKMVNKGNSSHVGSALSCVDLLVCLYSDYLKFDPQRPEWDERDIFILSKGHAGSAVYATLSEFGFFSEDKLLTHYQNGSDLSGHVSHKNVPGVEFSTGSLGHGLPVATGNALAFKKLKNKRKVCVLLSDGECDEGSNWEAAMFASHHKLNNLLCVIDYNQLQSLTTTEETLGLEPFADKWKAFGWDVREVDGHDYEAILDSLKKSSDKPICLIGHTTKGKGVSFMENSVLWHYRSPQGEEFTEATKELEEEK